VEAEDGWFVSGVERHGGLGRERRVEEGVCCDIEGVVAFDFEFPGAIPELSSDYRHTRGCHEETLRSKSRSLQWEGFRLEKDKCTAEKDAWSSPSFLIIVHYPKPCPTPNMPSTRYLQPAK
jgi:hypothetical protein